MTKIEPYKLGGKWKRIHFVGIGGVGMSPIAKLCLERGLAVSGSDIRENPNTIRLKTMGASLFYTHDATNIRRADVVVISSAIPDTNPERIQAQSVGIPVIKRGTALAMLMSDYPKQIAVAGTHGKTTCSGLLAHTFHQLRLDPTYLVGATVVSTGFNAALGHSPYFISESDESDGSFLELCPSIGIITNIEPEHIAHYGSFDALCTAFQTFMNAIATMGGTLVINADDPGVMSLASAITPPARTMTFGLSSPADVSASTIAFHPTKTTFTVHAPNHDSLPAEIPLLGRHNIYNSLAVIAAGLVEGIHLPDFLTSLSSFRGVGRRFEHIGSINDIHIYDDYAHHPTEIDTTLTGAKLANASRLICIFQPHRYSRTSQLLTEFGHCFSQADRVIITDIYGANEPNPTQMSGQDVVDVIATATNQAVDYVANKSLIPRFLIPQLEPGDTIVTMGAGDISSLAKELVNHLKSVLVEPSLDHVAI